MIEKESGAVVSDTRVLWCDLEICEERGSDGATVTRRAFLQGEQVGGANRFFATDHLGSVREVTDGTSAVLSRYSFDPWGRRSVIAGSDATTVGFTAGRWQSFGSLLLTLHRAYDPGIGRWISEDPIGNAAGLNRFQYVHNRVTVLVDPYGLKECCHKVKMWLCDRPIDAWYGALLPNHMYVCCDGPNTNCWGHRDNYVKKGDPIPRDGNATGQCRAVEVCEDVKQKKCNNPHSPCDASTTGWNCRDWAQWDGKSPCPPNDPYEPTARRPYGSK